MDLNKRTKRIVDTGLPFSRRSLRDNNSSEMAMVEKPTMAMMEIMEKRKQRATEKGDMRKVRGRPMKEDDGLITKSSFVPNLVAESFNSRTKDSDDELELNLEFPNSPMAVDETTPMMNSRNTKSGRMMPLQRGRNCRLSVQKLPSFEFVESVRRTADKSSQTINIREASTESDEPLSSRYISERESEGVVRKKRKMRENSSTSASVSTKKPKTVERYNNMSVHIIEQSDEDGSNGTADWGEICSPINRSVKEKCGSHAPLEGETCSPFSDNSKPNVAMIEMMEKKQQRVAAELNRSQSRRSRNSALFEASPSTRVTPNKTPTKPATYGIESYRSYNSTLLEASPSTRQANRIKTLTKSTTYGIEKYSTVSSEEEIHSPSRDMSNPNAAMIEMMEKKHKRVATELNRSQSRRSRNSTLIEASPRATTQNETPKKSATYEIDNNSTLDNSSVSSTEEAVTPKDPTKPTTAMLEIMEKRRKRLELNKSKSTSKDKKRRK